VTAREQIRVLAKGEDAEAIRVAGVKQYRRPSRALLDEFPHWFVVTRAVDLPDVADWVKDANRRRKLRGLLIHVGSDVQFATAWLQRAEIHALAPTLVHSDIAVLRRVIEAWAAGAQDRLIADATVQDGKLFVRTCGLELLEVAAGEVQGLRRVPSDELSEFEIDPDNSYLYWPSADVHIGVESIRVVVDPELHTKLRVEAIAYEEAFGRAIRALREGQGIRQRDIPNLSAKQVGRIERGEARPRLETLRSLAAAHGMEVDVYLDALAKEAAG